MVVESTGNIKHSFKMLEYISKEVALEQMSKAGSDVRKSIRRSFRANHTPTKVIVRKGKAGLYKGSINPYGVRISHSHEGSQSAKGAENMYNFIQSALMEEAGTLVVGGAFPRHNPKKRRNGKVVGTMGSQNAVSQKAISILHRMDTGEENRYYDKKTKLAEKITPRGFMKKGIRSAQATVRNRLEQGFITIMENAQANNTPETETRRLA